MIKYTKAYINRFDEKVRCCGCGKEMRLGECICNIKVHVCRACAEKGFRGKQRRGTGNV